MTTDKRKSIILYAAVVATMINICITLYLASRVNTLASDADIITQVIYYDRSVPPPTNYDASLTWSGYDGLTPDLSNITFYWNGDQIGHGPEGLYIVFMWMLSMPKNSTLLIYPTYDTPEAIRSGYPPTYPWVELHEYCLFEAIARSRTLCLAYGHQDPIFGQAIQEQTGVNRNGGGVGSAAQ